MKYGLVLISFLLLSSEWYLFGEVQRLKKENDKLSQAQCLVQTHVELLDCIAKLNNCELKNNWLVW